MPEDQQTTQTTPATPATPATDGGGKQSGGKGGGTATGGGATQPASDGQGGKGSGGGGGKPQGGNPFSSGTAGYQPGGSFYDFQARPIAGVNPFQQAGGKLAGGLPTAGQGGVQGAYGALGGAQGTLGQAGQAFGNMAGGDLNQYYQQMVGGAEGLSQLPGQTQEAMDLYRQMQGIAGKQVTGENLQSDPAIKAANAQFEKFMAPMIKDAAGLAGLGDSGVMTNALASQQAQTLLPLMQEGLAREERGIDRLLGGTQAGAAGLFGGGQQSANQLLSQLGLYGQAGQAQQQGQLAGAQGLAGVGGAQAGIGGALTGLGQQEQNMLMNAVSGLSGLGGQFRDIEQQFLNAPYDEQQRLWAEALNQVYGPLGMLGSTFGASSTTNQRGKK